MDAQGAIKIPELGPASIINITDIVSRVKVGSLPCLNPAHPVPRTTSWLCARRFVNYGLPQRISLDHDSVFFDNSQCLSVSVGPASVAHRPWR
jgi:hypothetical protein